MKNLGKNEIFKNSESIAIKMCSLNKSQGLDYDDEDWEDSKLPLSHEYYSIRVTNNFVSVSSIRLWKLVFGSRVPEERKIQSLELISSALQKIQLKSDRSLNSFN